MIKRRCQDSVRPTGLVLGATVGGFLLTAAVCALGQVSLSGERVPVRSGAADPGVAAEDTAGLEGEAAPVQLDGDLAADWGVHVQPEADFGPFYWLPVALSGAEFLVEDDANVDGIPGYVGPGYGGQDFDWEAVYAYLDIDDGGDDDPATDRFTLYVALVAGTHPAGERYEGGTYFWGDVFIDFGGPEGGDAYDWDVAVSVCDLGLPADGVEGEVNVWGPGTTGPWWDSPAIHADSAPYRHNDNAASLGTARAAWLAPSMIDHNVVELALVLTPDLVAEWRDGESVVIHWTQGSGNDAVTWEADIEPFLPGELVGWVTDAITASPVANATIQALREGSDLEGFTLTDAHGGYRLVHLKPGPYRVDVSADGYRSDSAWEDVFEDWVTDLDFALAPLPLAPASGGGVHMSVPTGITGGPGDEVTIPVSVSDATGVLGYFFELSYDSAILEYVAVDPGSLTAMWSLPTAHDQTGSVAVAGAGVTPLVGGGSLAILRMCVRESAVSGQSTALHFEAAELNDGGIPLTTSDGRVTVAALVHMSVPGRIAEDQGTIINVPVTVDDATAVLGYFFKLSFDNTIVYYDANYPPTTQGTLTEGWGYFASNAGAGWVSVAGAGTTELSGSGALVVVRLKVKWLAEPGMVSPLQFAAGDLNDGGLPVATADGWVVVTGAMDEVWADFAHDAVESGSYNFPFNTLGEAVDTVADSGRIKVKGNTALNTTPETFTGPNALGATGKTMRIEAIGGPVSIGKT